MEQRRFGRTGFDISAFTLGGGIVGGILINAPEETRLQALRRIVAAGCTWIDTAGDYGGGESELALGRLLPEVTPRPRLSTKVRLDVSRLDDLEGQIRRSIELSLERLRLDRVEVFQLHNQISATPAAGMISPHDVLRPGGVADIFDQLRQEGLFDAFGFTGLGEAKAIIEVLDSGRFDTVQVYYNMLNPSAGQAMPQGWSGQDFSGVIDACKRHDVGTMAIRVLAAGVLATDERHGREVIVTRDTDLDREQAHARLLFERLGDAHGTRAQTAIRYALTNPELSTLVVGVATLEQLDEALVSIGAGPLPESVMAQITAAYAHGF